MIETNYIGGGIPVRKGNSGGLSDDCPLIGGNIVGRKRASTGTSWDDDGDGIFDGWGLNQNKKRSFIAK